MELTEAKHECSFKSLSEDGECVSIVYEKGKWWFEGAECSGPFHILHCPFCGYDLIAALKEFNL